MYLVVATAVFVICGADKLDRTYLPPASAKTAGGADSLQTPFRTFNQGLGGLPKGGHRNEYDGIVVDAAAPGTRASGSDGTGLGGPRIAYGSTHSKVGDAAFTADTAFPRISVNSGFNAQGTYKTDAHESAPERIQAPRDRVSNTVKYQSDVNQDGFNYVFETDNGIAAREDAVEANGVNAQGGYSYTGDDGQVYSVTYTADERGYQPSGDHLPTPPPIPDEILKSLEQNAKDEASGVVDDGSYDAQKYNTGEDYTKSNAANEKYKAQPYPIGSRPHSDTDASGSFNVQNNQAIARPGSGQFGSISIKGSSVGTNGFPSKNTPSHGNSFGGINGQNGQASGFGSGSNNEYLPPHHTLNQNRRPAYSRPQNNIASGFTHNTVSSSAIKVNAGINGQNSDAPAFIPLSQQKLQGDNSKSAQSNSPIFGKPTIIDSTLAIKDPFGGRPFQRPQANAPVGGSFQVVSGNVFSSKNEYLPPRNQFNKPSQIKGTQGFQVTNSGPKSPQQFTDFKSQPNEYSSPSSTFSPISRPTFGFQSSQKFSGQQIPQYTSNNLASQLSQTINSRPSNKYQTHSSSGLSNFNKGPDGQSQYRPSNFASQFPTLQPQTELTTPLETNFDRTKFPDSRPVNDGPNSPSFSSSSISQTFNSQPSNTFPGLSSFSTHKTQQVSATQASSSAFAVNSHVSTSATQNVPEVGSFGSNLNNQFLNKSPADVQFASSTQRPSYSQNTQQQGSDDSYFYNTPSQAFNIPTSRPQVSVFPSSSFDQFKVTQPSFGTRDQPSDFSHTSFGSQSKIPISTTRYPGSSGSETILPTVSSTRDENIGISSQSQFNRVTQASATSFASPVPTLSTDFDRNKLDKYSASQSVQNRPQFSQQSQSSSLFNQPGSTIAQATATVYVNKQLTGFANPNPIQGPSSQFQQTQQHNGEVYEYNKPPQTLPAPQNNPSKQFGQTSQFSSSLPSQDSQSQNADSYKPNSQFGSKFTQQTGSSFGQTVQSSPINQGNQGFNINKQVQNEPESRPTQFGSFSKPTQPSENQAFNPSSQVQSQSASDSRPGYFDFSSKPGQDSKLSQGTQDFTHNTQSQARPQSESIPQQLSSHSSVPSQNTQQIQGASKFPPVYDTEGPPCCKNVNIGSQSSQSDQQFAGTQFGDANGTNQNSGQNEQSSQGTKPEQSVSTFPGVGETFGGPRKPPSFDGEGYHY